MKIPIKQTISNIATVLIGCGAATIGTSIIMLEGITDGYILTLSFFMLFQSYLLLNILGRLENGTAVNGQNKS